MQMDFIRNKISGSYKKNKFSKSGSKEGNIVRGMLSPSQKLK
jgi:hypothetical protein